MAKSSSTASLPATATAQAPATAPVEKEKVCPITRAQFEGKGNPLSVEIAGQKMVADKKEFASGSFGWYANGKVVVEIDGVPVKCQLGLNLTVINSAAAK